MTVTALIRKTLFGLLTITIVILIPFYSQSQTDPQPDYLAAVTYDDQDAGFLKVYSPSLVLNENGNVRNMYAPYTVYDEFGTRVKSVDSSIGEPAEVKLQRGIYLISLQFDSRKVVRKVTIEAGKVLELRF